MFRNIQRDELKIHKIISKEAAGLIKQLMEKNPDKRIKDQEVLAEMHWKLKNILTLRMLIGMKYIKKKIKPPNFFDFKNKYNKSYYKNKKFLNEYLNGKSKKQSKIKGWSFIENDEI